MALITNITALHATVAAVCPIDGVSADGAVFARPNATPAQLAAAHNAVTNFVDSPLPQVPDLAQLVQELSSLGVLPAANLARVMKTPPVVAAPATSIPIPVTTTI